MAAVTEAEVHGGAWRYTWALTTADATGDGVSTPGQTDRSVHVFGTFGGGTVNVEGSNEGTPTSWVPLHDSSGTAITFTAAGAAFIAENVANIRVTITGSTGASVTAIILGRKP